ncbi:porin family protein [Bacteriovoracaceae bacterium]|nr:porin family protein [Bacteriovoracaceae bacterium]
MLKTFTAITLSLFSIQTFAKDIQLKLINMSPKRTKILTQTSLPNNLIDGDQLILSNTCSFSVIKSVRNKILLSALKCPDRNRLKKNSTINVNLAKKTKHKSIQQTQTDLNTSLTKRRKTSKGFRIGLNQANLDGRFTISSDNELYSSSIEDDVEHQYGINVGYVNIGLLRPGFMGHITHTQFTQDIESIRLTANGTFSFHENIYAYAGMNIHRYTNELTSTILDPGVGYQAGLGIQINETFGLDISYLVLRNKGSDPDFEVDYELELEGLEATLHVTF